MDHNVKTAMSAHDKLSPPPMVSVLMPVYNGEKYLDNAIESIIGQTFYDWEFLIIDDGSTDNTPQIIKEYALKDNRFKIIRNVENMGITNALNKGLSLSSGKYIARMDSDDISLPNRLERQVDYLERNSSVGICGTWARTIGAGRNTVLKHPTEHNEIMCALLFSTAFAHPSVMLSRDVLKNYNLLYSKEYPHAEDYEFWVRCSRYTKLANLNEILLHLRQHESNISVKCSLDQNMTSNKIRKEQINQLGINPSENEMIIHNRIAHAEWEPSSREFVISIESWLRRLWDANKIMPRYPEPAFSTTLAMKWFAVCCQASRLGVWTFIQYTRSPLYAYNPATPNDIMKFALRCLVMKGRWRSKLM